MIAAQEPMTRMWKGKTAGKTQDPMVEINSPAFLKALLSGAPSAPRAFRTLVNGMHPQLARYVGRWFRDKDQIQDVLQETFLAVHRALPRFERKSKLTTWVYSLAHHKVCDRLAEKYRPGCGQSEAGEHGWELESSEPGPDETLHQSRLAKYIRSAAETLPPLYRDAHRLRDLEELTGEEAADALGISPTLIRVRLHRARALIVECLQKRHPGLFTEGIFA